MTFLGVKHTLTPPTYFLGVKTPTPPQGVDKHAFINSQFKLVKENDIAAMVDQQVLMAGNYNGVTEIFGAKCQDFFRRAPINLVCAPCAATVRNLQVHAPPDQWRWQLWIGVLILWASSAVMWFYYSDQILHSNEFRWGTEVRTWQKYTFANKLQFILSNCPCAFSALTVLVG